MLSFRTKTRANFISEGVFTCFEEMEQLIDAVTVRNEEAKKEKRKRKSQETQHTRIGKRKMKKTGQPGYEIREDPEDAMDVEELPDLERFVVSDSRTFLERLNGPDPPDLQTDLLERAPVWQDEDDVSGTVEDVFKEQGKRFLPVGVSAGDLYEDTLRSRFKQIHGDPKWAKLDKKKSAEDPDMAMLRTCGNMLESTSQLPRGQLRFKQLASINSETRTEGPIIKTVEFHKTSTVAMVAGLSGIVSLFQVDGRGNKKLASIKFNKFPIKCAHFTTDGQQFIVGSQKHSHFHVYDMIHDTTLKVHQHHSLGMTNMKNFEVSPDGKLIAVAGKFGQIHLLAATSKEWIDTLSMNGEVLAMAFNGDGSKLYTHGEMGEVYAWDMSRRSLSGRFWDDGCLQGVSLAVSPCDTYLATGSTSGVVNIYDQKTISSSLRPAPLKALMNLTTSATKLGFNHSSQMLAISSEDKENAVKLIHLPSLTAYSNFPAFNSELKRVQCMDFSPSSGYFAMGNNKQTAMLFRLNHFGNY